MVTLGPASIRPILQIDDRYDSAMLVIGMDSFAAVEIKVKGGRESIIILESRTESSGSAVRTSSKTSMKPA